jgi:hypothetical protein
MRAARILLICVCCLFTTAFSWTDMSGTYIGKGPNLVVMVQIVETNGGSFTGRYEQVALKPDGQVEDMNATISGSRSGETVVATLKTVDFFAATVPLSGTYRSGVLHLSGGTNFVLNLTSGEEADFRAQVGALNAQGQQIIGARNRQQAAEKQAKLESDRLSKLQNLTSRLIAFNTKADQMLPKFAPTEQQWRTITEKMRGGLARQQSIYGGGQAAVARSQLTVALNQAAIEANQIHINAQGSYQTFDFNSGQLAHEAAEANGWCQGSVPPSLLTACPKFAEAETSFAKHVSALRAAFAELEQVWTTERHEQDAIIQASQRSQ